MKKLISFFLTSVLMLGSGLAQNSVMPSHKSFSFFNNYQWLVQSNAFTNIWNASNVFVLNNSSLTNQQTFQTNLNGNSINLGWEKDGTPDLADGLGNLNTNNSGIFVMLNNTNVIMQQYQTFPPSWYTTNGTLIYGNVTNVFTNSYGIVSTNVQTYAPVPTIIPTANSTNVITFTFYRGYYSTFYSTNANDTFSFSVTATGLTPTMFTTNFPASFLSSAHSIRLQSIVSGAGTGPGVLVNDVRFSGWSP